MNFDLTVDGSFGNTGTGPRVTVYGFAYDDSGSLIAAGDLGSAVATPEPGTLLTSGLAALALGASAWRRKKSKSA
jgi:hypothetical protein